MDEGKGNESINSMGVSSNNEDYNTTGVIQIRLNTDPMINKIENYLKGQETKFVSTKEGLVMEETFQMAPAKANNQGVYGIMSWIKSSVNSQIVQGNIKDFDDLNIHLRDYRMNLAENIMINLQDWAINEKDFEGIIDMVMNMVTPFMSRLVGNKERESYASTIQHTERSDTQREGRKSFPFFG